MILDYEFKLSKTRMIREEIRQEYDNHKSKLSVLEGQIKSQKEKPTMKKDEIARLDDNKILLDKEIEKKIGQMKALDIEINGSKPTNEYPDGVQGITQYIDNLQELKVMLKDYMSKL